jgi:hypothetical protein
LEDLPVLLLAAKDPADLREVALEVRRQLAHPGEELEVGDAVRS